MTADDLRERVVLEERAGDAQALPHRRLTLLAEVAERLLAADDPAAMVDEMFELVRTELRLDAFFNYRFDDGVLVLEAHAGLTEQEAKEGRVLALGQAVCGCVARDRSRLHAAAVQRSADPMLAFVKQVGLDSYACTPLLHGTELLGTLGFGRKWAERFSEDELSFLHTICHYVALAKYRLRLEEQLRAGLSQREALLSELNHRVRNSLQIAIALVAIEAREAAQPEVRAALERSVARLEVLAIAHRPLYAGGGRDAVEIESLLRETAGEEAAFDPVEGGPYLLDAEPAIALALLVRILLETGKPRPTIAIAAAQEAAGRMLTIGLRGVGGERDEPSGAGARIVDLLSRQIGADIRRDGDGALCVTMPLPLAA